MQPYFYLQYYGMFSKMEILKVEFKYKINIREIWPLAHIAIIGKPHYKMIRITLRWLNFEGYL
jgi:hypothetical protein